MILEIKNNVSSLYNITYSFIPYKNKSLLQNLSIWKQHYLLYNNYITVD